MKYRNQKNSINIDQNNKTETKEATIHWDFAIKKNKKQ